MNILFHDFASRQTKYFCAICTSCVRLADKNRWANSRLRIARVIKSVSRGRFKDSGFDRFLHSQVASSGVLVFFALLALIWANTPLSDQYFALAKVKLGFSLGDSAYVHTLGHWIKDGLMAIFFFVVGLEIKRELVVGELSSIRRAALPVSAAIGGAVVPALAYAFFNYGGAGSSGWGIPMATDIAFALGVLALFGSRVPIGLKVILTASLSGVLNIENMASISPYLTIFIALAQG